MKNTIISIIAVLITAVVISASSTESYQTASASHNSTPVTSCTDQNPCTPVPTQTKQPTKTPCPNLSYTPVSCRNLGPTPTPHG